MFKLGGRLNKLRPFILAKLNEVLTDIFICGIILTSEIEISDNKSRVLTQLKNCDTI